MDIAAAALSGLQQAQATLNGVATRIAKATDPAGAATGDIVDLSAEAVAMMQARNTAAISVKMMHVADDVQRQVLNLLA
jgi:hypothetical protein